MKVRPGKYSARIGRTLIGKIWADGQVEDKLELEARNKALRKLWRPKGRPQKPSGKRYELLEGIKTAEITLGHGRVRLDHYPVREAIEDASIHEAATITTLSKRTVCQLLASGKLPSKRVGRRRIIFRSALESFLGTKLA